MGGYQTGFLVQPVLARSLRIGTPPPYSCLESKRECIFRASPRSRPARHRAGRRGGGQDGAGIGSVAAESSDPSSSSSSVGIARGTPAAAVAAAVTFTIDFDSQAPPGPDADSPEDALCARHERLLDELVLRVGKLPGSLDTPHPSLSSALLSSLPTSSPSTTFRSAVNSGSSSSSSSPSRGQEPKPHHEHQPPSCGPSSSGRRPQFNLSSASALLAMFLGSGGDGEEGSTNDGGMLSRFPCVSIPSAGAARSVPELARTRPFLLLAMLAAASAASAAMAVVLPGSGTPAAAIAGKTTTAASGMAAVAGGSGGGGGAGSAHALYDGEFRRVLGQRATAGGERSLELLQGLVVYCGWFPFRLAKMGGGRGKKGGGGAGGGTGAGGGGVSMAMFVGYLRLVVGMVADLGLDVAPDSYDDDDDGGGVDDNEDREAARTYLASHYLTSA